MCTSTALTALMTSVVPSTPIESPARIAPVLSWAVQPSVIPDTTHTPGGSPSAAATAGETMPMTLPGGTSSGRSLVSRPSDVMTSSGQVRSLRSMPALSACELSEATTSSTRAAATTSTVDRMSTGPSWPDERISFCRLTIRPRLDPPATPTAVTPPADDLSS